MQKKRKGGRNGIEYLCPENVPKSMLYKRSMLFMETRSLALKIKKGEH
jgi:hypothetical protein